MAEEEGAGLQSLQAGQWQRDVVFYRKRNHKEEDGWNDELKLRHFFFIHFHAIEKEEIYKLLCRDKRLPNLQPQFDDIADSNEIFKFTYTL